MNKYTVVKNWLQTSSELLSGSSTSTDVVITSTDVVITTAGIYLLSFTAKVNAVTVGYKAIVFINSTQVLQGQVEFLEPTGDPETISLSLAMYLKPSNTLSFSMYAEGSGMELIEGTTRSLIKVNGLHANYLTTGLCGILTIDQQILDKSAIVITGWETNNTLATFLANVSLGLGGSLVFLKGGVFRVTLNILIRNDVSVAR